MRSYLCDSTYFGVNEGHLKPRELLQCYGEGGPSKTASYDDSLELGQAGLVRSLCREGLRIRIAGPQVVLSLAGS
jgi:hypothetical protein